MIYENPKPVEPATLEPCKLQICKKLAIPATLDGTPKQCSERLTNGEELKNR